MIPELQEIQSVIIALVSIFGSIISLLLMVIGFLIARWAKRLDVRMDTQDNKIGNLEVVQGQHTIEIKNIHHRIKKG